MFGFGLLEAVVAVVVPRPGQTVDEEDVVRFCRDRLAGFKSPKYLAVSDALPKNASGKILKRDLRTTFAHLAG